MEELVKECGFDSLAEFNELVNSVDLTTRDNIDSFKLWQNEDGSKFGLVALLMDQKVKSNTSENITSSKCFEL